MLHKRLHKLRQQQNHLAVAGPNTDHFLQQLLVFLLLQREMILRRLQFLFDLRDALVEVVHQVLLLVIDCPLLFLLLKLLVSVLDLSLKLFYLAFVLLDNFLTEMRSLGELILYLLVIGQVFL